MYTDRAISCLDCGQEFTFTGAAPKPGDNAFVVDDNTVTAVVPAGVAGAVDVTVTDNVGSDTLTGGYTYE